MGLGFGGLRVVSRVEADDGPDEARHSGGGAAFELMLGGTPTPGLVIGGGLLWQGAARPRVAVSDASAEGLVTEDPLGFALVGPMIDGFPDPFGGFHIGGMLGPAFLGLDDGSGNSSNGFGGALWVGYDWWIADDWSLGGLLRLSGARTARELSAGDTTDTARAISLLFTALYH